MEKWSQSNGSVVAIARRDYNKQDRFNLTQMWEGDTDPKIIHCFEPPLIENFIGNGKAFHGIQK